VPLRVTGALTGWLVLLAAAAPAQSGVVSREEALESAFTGAAIAADRVYLTADQADRIAELSRGSAPSRIYARYVATRNGVVVGRAYVDTHVVRTKSESLLVALTSDGAVRRVEVTAFLEPRDYLAPQAWLRQFDSQPLNDDVALQRAIRPIAGATLTAQSATDAVRRVMAIDEVLEGQGRR
jgi:electron transport complex protein RnfG